MIAEEQINKLREAPELQEKIFKSWRDGATAQSIADELTQNGIAIKEEDVEMVLTVAQSFKAQAIIDEDVDDKVLRTVSGGSDSADDCYGDHYANIGEGCTGTFWCYSNYVVPCTSNFSW